MDDEQHHGRRGSQTGHLDRRVRCGSDSLAVGNPADDPGRPVIEAIDMPDIAANAYPVCVRRF